MVLVASFLFLSGCGWVHDYVPGEPAIHLSSGRLTYRVISLDGSGTPGDGDTSFAYFYMYIVLVPPRIPGQRMWPSPEVFAKVDSLGVQLPSGPFTQRDTPRVDPGPRGGAYSFHLDPITIPRTWLHKGDFTVDVMLSVYRSYDSSLIERRLVSLPCHYKRRIKTPLDMYH